MKKLLICMTVVAMLFLSSCSDQKHGMEESMIEYKIGVFDFKNWLEQDGAYQGDVIPNEKVAVLVATQIFNGIDKNIAEQAYIPQQVFYDEEDEVWIVSFWPEDEEMGLTTLGGDCSIAMQKKDGKVLRIWFWD